MPITNAQGQSIVAVVTSLIPEIMGIIRSYHATHNAMPSDDFVINQLNIDVNRVVATSDAWLAAHPPSAPLNPPFVVSSTPAGTIVPNPVAAESMAAHAPLGKLKQDPLAGKKIK